MEKIPIEVRTPERRLRKVTETAAAKVWIELTSWTRFSGQAKDGDYFAGRTRKRGAGGVRKGRKEGMGRRWAGRRVRDMIEMEDVRCDD